LEGLKVEIFIVAGLKRGRREAWLRRKGACYGIVRVTVFWRWEPGADAMHIELFFFFF